MYLVYRVPFKDVARFQWAMYKSINFLIPQRFLSIQRKIEKTNRPSIFSNSIIYYFSSSLHQSMPWSVHASTDHIKLNQGGNRGISCFQVINGVVIIQCSLEGKFAIKCQTIIASDRKYLESQNKEIWVEKILSSHFTAKDIFQGR